MNKTFFLHYIKQRVEMNLLKYFDVYCSKMYTNKHSFDEYHL